MKRLMKWLNKIDKLSVVLIMAGILVWILTKETEPVLAAFYTLVVIPIILSLLKDIIYRQQENSFITLIYT